MHTDLELGLLSRYRSIFTVDKYKTPSVIGIHCEDGWFSLVEAMCIITSMHCKANPLLRIDRGDEIAGKLIFSFDISDPVMENLAALVELVSSCTCELCGAFGKIYERAGTGRARCDAHKNYLPTYEGECPDVDRDYSRQLSLVIAAVQNFFEPDMGAAFNWLINPAYSLGGKAPISLVFSSEGCNKILTLLGRIEHGVMT